MTKSVYIIGGAGTGKSTFTGQLLSSLGELGPLYDLWSKPNSRGTVITLRGHQINGGEGLYLGCMRDSFPGTDGLDRVSYIPGEAWLEAGGQQSFRYLVAEGATLAVRRFIRPLSWETDLLLVHLWADDFVKELRFHERGSDQDPKFVTATETRSRNLWNEMRKEGVRDLDVDTADPAQWSYALGQCIEHVLS